MQNLCLGLGFLFFNLSQSEQKSSLKMYINSSATFLAIIHETTLKMKLN